MEDTPIVKPLYHYKALDFLYKSTSEFGDTITLNNIIFCPYQIIESNKH